MPENHGHGETAKSKQIAILAVSSGRLFEHQTDVSVSGKAMVPIAYHHADIDKGMHPAP